MLTHDAVSSEVSTVLNTKAVSSLIVLNQGSSRLLQKGALHISVRHSIRPRPILNMIKITTHMLSLIIRPIATHTLLALFLCRLEREDIDVAQTHQIDPENLDAVVEMPAHLLRRIVSIAPRDFLVMIGIRRHAQQIEAVQLVKHFDADAVPCFTGRGVGDLHCVVRLAQLVEICLRDHLVGH